MIEEDIRKIRSDVEMLQYQVTRLVEALSTEKKEKTDEWFSIADAAEYTKLSRGTIRVYLSKGIIKCSKWGRRTVISRKSLDEYLNANKVKTVQQQAEEVYKSLNAL